MQTLPAHEIANSQDFEFALRWAFKNLGLDPEGLQDDLIPNPTCREVLRFAKADNKSFFAWIAKYDQKRADDENTARVFKDDRRTQFALIQRVKDYERDAAAKRSAELVNLPPSNAATAATSS